MTLQGYQRIRLTVIIAVNKASMIGCNTFNEILVAAGGFDTRAVGVVVFVVDHGEANGFTDIAKVSVQEGEDLAVVLASETAPASAARLGDFAGVAALIFDDFVLTHFWKMLQLRFEDGVVVLKLLGRSIK